MLFGKHVRASREFNMRAKMTFVKRRTGEGVKPLASGLEQC